jgi:hypothetical protein
MRRFLTLKHWQLFVLLVGMPIIFEFLIIGVAISSRDPRTIFYFFPVMLILYVGLFFGWLYSLGTNLFKRLPVTARMSLTRFKIFLLVYVGYMLFFLVFMFGIFSAVASGGEPSPLLFALIFPINLFAMFCIFYCLYFTAKVLKTVELQKPVTFNDYAGEFFLIWFFPIGIWFIQPRINRLFNGTGESSGDSIFDNI